MKKFHKPSTTLLKRGDSFKSRYKEWKRSKKKKRVKSKIQSTRGIPNMKRTWLSMGSLLNPYLTLAIFLDNPVI